MPPPLRGDFGQVISSGNNNRNLNLRFAEVSKTSVQRGANDPCGEDAGKDPRGEE